MGGVEPAGGYVLELLRSGRAGRHGEQAARRPARRRAVRGSGRGRRAAALRGLRLRRDPGDQGAARVARRHERPPRARDRQRDDELHPLGDGGRPLVRRRARRGAAARLSRRPTRRRTWTGSTPPRRRRSWPRLRSASRVPLEWVEVEGIEGVTPEHVAAARALDMHVKLIGRATLVGDRVDVRVGPAFVDAHHPLAAVEGAFNAVMLQGDAIREITLEGPGAGGIETASAVVADMVSVVGTTGTGFLQNDPVWRALERLPAGELASPFYLRLEVEDRAGVLARHRAGARGRRRLGGAARPAARRRARGPPRRHARGSGRAGRGGARRRSARSPSRAGTRAPCRWCPIAASRSSAGRDECVDRDAGAHRPLPRPPARDRARRPSSRSGRARRRCSPCPRLSERLGVELWLKWEASNPTGSYKDRGMTVAVSKAVEEGAEAVICASTGNTAASRRGVRRPRRDPGARAHAGGRGRGRQGRADAHVRRHGCSRSAATSTRRSQRRRSSRARGTHALVNSLNPYRREGQKTAVFEIVEELGAAPDAFVIPYGGGGNTSAYAQGSRELGSRHADRLGRGRAPRRHARLGDPHRRPRPRRQRRGVGRRGRDRRRRGDRRRLARARRRSRDCSASRPRAAGLAAVRRGDVAGRARRGHDHRPRPQGPRERRALRSRPAGRSTPIPTRSPSAARG